MNLQEKRSLSGSDDQHSSVGDSLVSLTVLQESVKRLVMTVTSGRSSGESFGRLDPDGCYLKMSRGSIQVSLDGFLEKCYGMWPQWGTLLGGVLGKLPMSEPPTTENESLFLATLRSREAGNYQYASGDHNKPILTLSGQIAMLPTLNTCDATMGQLKGKEFMGNKHAMKLEQAINLLPTVTTPRPHDSEETAGTYIESQNQKDLTYALGKNHGLKLQPAFAEWMMGFPIGYTDLPLSEMPSSPNKSIQSSKQSRKQKKECE